MKKFNENDIGKMLSKTEKTEPSFERKVNFTERKPLIAKRRSLIIPLVACLAFVAVAAGVIFSVPEETPRGVVPPVNNSKPVSGNTHVSFNSIPPTVSSEYVSDFSYEHSDFSDPFYISDGEHFPSVSYDTSDTSVPDNVVYPTIEYPSKNIIFADAVLKDGQSVDDYLSSNYIKYLEAKLELPIYQRTQISDNMKNILLETLSNGFRLEPTLNELTVSDFGDWKLDLKQTVLSTEHNGTGFDNSFYESLVSDFINNHSSIFGARQYKYKTVKNDTSILVEVFEANGDKGLIAEYPIYLFEFSVNDASSSLSSIKHNNHQVEILGNFKTRLYNSATGSLFANDYYSASNFEFSDGDSYVFLGYDVRYVISEHEALICPYYAFVLRVLHADKSTSVQTLFVPAIDERYLG